MVVSVYIARTGLRLVRQAVGGLMDRQDVEDEALLRRILDGHLGPAGAEPRICGYHKLRHRHSGRYHWVDFHITVPADWDIARGHKVASAIEYEIEQALGEGNATAHVEPCEERDCVSCGAPREAVTVTNGNA
jgi:divalent metal cation (Fe/Co/Zn/Cd) transporter